MPGPNGSLLAFEARSGSTATLAWGVRAFAGMFSLRELGQAVKLEKDSYHLSSPKSGSLDAS